jgi:bifunctional DNA-binding transcriptional regulator/antitoxin component of YhaV-PrlF toxin-antitoxin module
MLDAAPYRIYYFGKEVASMTKSTITAKNQTTVPREIRKKLAVGPSDVLQWEVVGSRVLVSAARPAFLSRKGTIKVGPGDPVEDVRKARKLMGFKGR